MEYELDEAVAGGLAMDHGERIFCKGEERNVANGVSMHGELRHGSAGEILKK